MKITLHFGESFFKWVKRVFLIIFMVIYIGIYWLFIACVLPNLNASSVQTGLTLRGEIRGVLLGLIIAVIILIVEQSARAVEFLRAKQIHYGERIEKNKHLFETGCKDTIAFMKENNKKANNSVINKDIPPRYKDVLGNLISLMIATGVVDLVGKGKYVQELIDLGFSENERVVYLDRRGSEAQYYPEIYMGLIYKSLTPETQWYGKELKELYDLSKYIHKSFMQEGIVSALEKYYQARYMNYSVWLPATILFTTITIIGSVLLSFVATDQMLKNGIYYTAIIYIIAGFLISVIFMIIFVGQLISKRNGYLYTIV